MKQLRRRPNVSPWLVAALLASLASNANATPPAPKSSTVSERGNGGDGVRWDTLPLQYAIVTKRGTGGRKIAVLADPNCDYCKKFEEELLKVDDITVYVLPYPVVRAQSVRQVKAIWCSKDPAKAWEDLLFRRIEPPSVPPCNDPIDKIVAFGSRLGVDATPTWFLENGERHSGVKRADEVRQLLDRASLPRR